MSTPLNADTVAAAANSGTGNTGLPGLDAFTSAWSALVDFTGVWAHNNILDVQTYGDVVTSLNIGG